MGAKFIYTLILLGYAIALPIENISVDDLFRGINELLKRDIKKAFNNETEIEVGDSFKQKTNHSESQITIQTFSFTGNSFPVIFKPGNESVVEDKEIISIKGHFDDSASVYKIENDDSDERTEFPEDTTEKPRSKSLTESLTTNIDKIKSISKEDKLIKDASTQPIFSNV